MIPLSWYMALATVLFCIGVAGFLTRRSIIVMLFSLELMLNGVNLNLVSMSYFMDALRGQAFTVFIITVAACEAAVGLGIVICLFRSRRSVRSEHITTMRG